MTLTTLISYIINGVRTLTVSGMGKGNVRSAGEIAPSGVDCGPASGLTALYATTGNNGDRVIIGYVNTNQLAQPGECRIYWTDANGNEKGKIWGHNDGTVEIAGTSGIVNANHATQYEALNTELTLYINNLNASLTAMGSTWGGTWVPPTTPLDLSTAKATKILIP